MADVAHLQDTGADEPVAIFKKRGAKGKSNIRKRPATPPLDPDSDTGSEYSSEDESGHTIKRRRKGNILTAGPMAPKLHADALGVTKYTGDRSTKIEDINDATKQSNWYDENGKDALDTENLLGKTRARPIDGPTQSDGTYKGTKNYQSFIQKNPNAPERKMGPVKAPTNIRTITVTDYAPDVCKDYKQTGYCGFGDSCKFLHARESYAQGWQLDKEWEVNSKGKKKQKAEPEDPDEEMLKKIPFACIICKQPYDHPIVTRCNHYFCEDCAIKRYRKDPSCAACGTGTGGVFNGAKNLKKLLERKKEREERRREQAEKEGREVSDEETQKSSGK
ncbi:pre-mRNA-splicing factor cwc24 [Viridothelium virens]|uniref:Pre-mRNA-splicing factor CWC24 n=1 Tax=Viridothelium virens TaxID=1048519 RepID=A0A6A6HCA3_VIRVR|nr:pre-mRNA-splicing factor cwc24 [Viridothelium virens]